MEEINDFFKKQSLRFDSTKTKIWFTSDTHFMHYKIIEYCDRPYKDEYEMTEALINNWNSVVGPDDIVFHLGDFAWGGSKIWNSILDRLNGHIYLILGNHDMKNIKEGYINRFESVVFQMFIYIDGKAVYLNHYPFLCYGGAYREGKEIYQLFGHVHSKPDSYHIENIDDPEVQNILGKDIPRLQYLMPTQYDVGVDNNGYRPVSWEEVKEKIEKQINSSKK